VRLSWQVLVAVLSLAYPLAWYWGREAGLFSWLAGGMAVLWGVRALLQRTRGQRVLSWVLAAFFVLVLLFERQHAMYWYPVLVNLLMLALFGGSLLTGQSIVERLARMQHPDLPPRGARPPVQNREGHHAAGHEVPGGHEHGDGGLHRRHPGRQEGWRQP